MVSPSFRVKIQLKEEITMISTYNEKEIAKRMHFTTLTPVGKYGFKGKYNVYSMDTNGKLVVVFGDQERLLNHINKNLNNPFLIRFLHKTNGKYSYSVQTDEDSWLDVITVASAHAVSISSRKKCDITVTDKGGIIIE